MSILDLDSSNLELIASYMSAQDTAAMRATNSYIARAIVPVCGDPFIMAQYCAANGHTDNLRAIMSRTDLSCPHMVCEIILAAYRASTIDCVKYLTDTFPHIHGTIRTYTRIMNLVISHIYNGEWSMQDYHQIARVIPICNYMIDIIAEFRQVRQNCSDVKTREYLQSIKQGPNLALLSRIIWRCESRSFISFTMMNTLCREINSKQYPGFLVRHNMYSNHASMFAQIGIQSNLFTAALRASHPQFISWFIRANNSHIQDQHYDNHIWKTVIKIARDDDLVYVRELEMFARELHAVNMHQIAQTIENLIAPDYYHRDIMIPSKFIARILILFAHKSRDILRAVSLSSMNYLLSQIMSLIPYKKLWNKPRANGYQIIRDIFAHFAPNNLDDCTFAHLVFPIGNGVRVDMINIIIRLNYGNSVNFLAHLDNIYRYLPRDDTIFAKYVQCAINIMDQMIPQ